MWKRMLATENGNCQVGTPVSTGREEGLTSG
jgi:hypothetical protein